MICVKIVQFGCVLLVLALLFVTTFNVIFFMLSAALSMDLTMEKRHTDKMMCVCILYFSVSTYFSTENHKSLQGSMTETGKLNQVV